MPRRQGFSLLELAIVLAVLGVLVGGVMVGKSLIRASEVRSYTSEHARFIIAIRQFRDKYSSLPGDMPNATRFWGIAAGATGNNIICAAAASTTTATCNGDGDGKVRTILQGPESTRFWQHLGNAELIEGRYTGAFAGGGSGKTSANSPASKFPRSLWAVFNFLTVSGSTRVFDGEYNNVMWAGARIAADDPYTGIMLPEELWSVDRKIDDGKPATGKLVIYSYSSAFSNCTYDPGGGAVTSATLNAEYKVDSNIIECIGMFRGEF